MLPDFRVRQRDYLLEIARLLTEELDLEKLLARILKIAIEMLAGQAGLIALKEPEGWRVATAHNIPPAFLSYLTPLLAEEKVADLDVAELNRMLKDLTYTASMGLLNGTGSDARRARPGDRRHLHLPQLSRPLLRQRSRPCSVPSPARLPSRSINARLYRQVNYEKQRLDALLDSAADGIIILNADLTIERVNDAFEHIYGQNSRPAGRACPTRRSSAGRANPRASTLEQAIESGWPLTPNASLYVEGDLERPEPPTIPVGVTYAPLLNAEGKLRNVIVTVRDITHFRNADEIKSTFISIVSHELRTPGRADQGLCLHPAARRRQMGQAHHQRLAGGHRGGSRPPRQDDR